MIRVVYILMGIAFLGLLGVQPVQAESDNQDRFLNETFEQFQLRKDSGGYAILPDLHVGDVLYLPVTALTRGQLGIDVVNLRTKISDRERLGDITPLKHGRYKLNRDNGRSDIPLDDPINVNLGPEGLIVIDDGTHDYYSAVHLGAETVPVRIIEDGRLNADGSVRTLLEFWVNLKNRSRVFLDDSPEQLAARAPQFDEIVNFPDRQLVTLLALKISTLTPDGIIVSVPNPNAVWMKIDSSIPFVEFLIARILGRAGLHYDPKWGDKVPPRIVRRARGILLEAQRIGEPEFVKAIPILKSHKQVEDLSSHGGHSDALVRFVRAFLTQESCEAALQGE